MLPVRALEHLSNVLRDLHGECLFVFSCKPKEFPLTDNGPCWSRNCHWPDLFVEEVANRARGSKSARVSSPELVLKETKSNHPKPVRPRVTAFQRGSGVLLFCCWLNVLTSVSAFLPPPFPFAHPAPPVPFALRVRLSISELRGRSRLPRSTLARSSADCHSS